MCFGGGGYGDTSGSASETRPGEEPYNPGTKAIPDRPGIPGKPATPSTGGEAQTYRAAMGPVEQFMGGQQSDQDYENDRRMSAALGDMSDAETGKRMFTNVNTNQRQSVDSYSRESSGVRPGSLMDRINQPATLGIFKAASMLAPFPFSIPASIVGGRLDKALGTGFTLGGDKK